MPDYYPIKNLRPVVFTSFFRHMGFSVHKGKDTITISTFNEDMIKWVEDVCLRAYFRVQTPTKQGMNVDKKWFMQIAHAPDSDYMAVLFALINYIETEQKTYDQDMFKFDHWHCTYSH